MEVRPGGAAALIATCLMTLFTAGFLMGGGPEYWKFAVFIVSVVALAMAVVFMFAPGALRIPRLRTGRTDPGGRVRASRIGPLILETQYILMGDLPISKQGPHGSGVHGSVS
jgi:hypothetical protein